MVQTTPPATLRPTVMGRHFMASSGHYLATAAAIRILEAGGNATDAGVAAGFCLNVVQPEYTNLGGVAPIILYDAGKRVTRTISGLGWWPKGVQTDYFTIECGGELRPGVHRLVMPAAADSWMAALQEFGSKSLAEVLAPAIELAEGGFPLYPLLKDNLARFEATMRLWVSSTDIFFPNGQTPAIGELLIQRDLGRTLRRLVEAEETACHLGREAGIQAARDRFYRGDIAEEMAAFVAEGGGFLTADDLAAFSVEIQEPAKVSYRGYDVLGCGPWCQGPVALQALNILEGYDLAALGHNSADSLHLILEALKAAFTDRERYYGDPNFIDVPVRGLLAADYAANWRDRIDLARAAPGMPEPGDAWQFEGSGRPATDEALVPSASSGAFKLDTSYLCVVDADGNAFSATPSDGVGESPIVPGLGFAISDRGIQSRLDPNHPSAIAPGKRPRLTPNPGLIMRDGRVVAPYGTPGGDVQPQAMVQFVVNLIDHGFDPQAAIEAPRVATYSFPESFFPFPYRPDLVKAEARLPESVVEDLRQRGHNVERWPDWSAAAGSLCAVVIDHEHGTLHGAADPRRVGYAMGW